MQKIQTLSIHLKIKDMKNPPIFCPFSGKKLVYEDPEYDISSDWPETVMFIYATEYIADYPFKISSEFKKQYDELGLDGIADEEELMEKLEKLDDDHQYIALSVSLSGGLPGDFGGWIFLLRGL
jgi:hypothetical protein